MSLLLTLPRCSACKALVPSWKGDPNWFQRAYGTSALERTLTIEKRTLCACNAFLSMGLCLSVQAVSDDIFQLHVAMYKILTCMVCHTLYGLHLFCPGA